MPTNIPVDDGGDLIVSISVARRCHSTTACHNVSRPMEEVGLTSRYRTWVSFLSTGDCSVRRRYRPCMVFQFPDPHTKRTVAHAEIFRIHLLEDIVGYHGPTSMLVLRRVVFSEIPPRLCSKAASHAIDRVPGLSRVTLIYNEHVRMGTITEVTVQPNNARFVHCLDLLQPLTAFTTRSIQSLHVC